MVDVSGRRREPKGIPTGGRFADETGGASDASDLADPFGPMPEAAPVVEDAERTRDLIARAAGFEFGPDGARPLDADGRPLTDAALDTRTAKASSKFQAAVRERFASDMSDIPYQDRRKAVKQMWRMSNAYTRRRAIDGSPNRRFIPSESIANSLRRRRDSDAAVSTLVDLFHEDANAASAVIRNGFPRDRKGAFAFINKTKNLHGKDGKPVHGWYEDKDGKPKFGVLPNPKGAAARSYLRMLYQPTKGVPTDPTTRKAVVDALNQIGEVGGPTAQAKAFWNICYGDGSPTNLRGDVDYAKSIVAGRRANRFGVGKIDEYSHGGRAQDGSGQGNAARMAAYEGGLTHEAAVAFCAMEPRDPKVSSGKTAHAHTYITRRRRNAKTGLMENVKPRRLSEMRSYIHQAYSVSDSEVARYKADHPEDFGGETD